MSIRIAASGCSSATLPTARFAPWSKAAIAMKGVQIRAWLECLTNRRRFFDQVCVNELALAVPHQTTASSFREPTSTLKPYLGHSRRQQSLVSGKRIQPAAAPIESKEYLKGSLYLSTSACVLIAERRAGS